MIWDSFRRHIQRKVHLGRENTSGLVEGRRLPPGQECEHSLKAGVAVVATGQHHRSRALLREGMLEGSEGVIERLVPSWCSNKCESKRGQNRSGVAWGEGSS